MVLATGAQLILSGNVFVDIPQVNLTNALEIFLIQQIVNQN